jgi:cytochrome P450
VNKETMPSMMDPATLQHPYALYAALREQAPVHFMPEMNMYIVTSYSLLMQVMKNTKVFSNIAGEGRRGMNYCEEAEQIVKDGGHGRLMPTIVNNDPPGHTAYRKLVNDAFRAGRVRQMDAYVREIVDGLVDGMIDGIVADNSDSGACDAIAEFAVPIPMYVIADQLGVDRSMFQTFKEWSDAWVIGLGLPQSDEVLIDAAKKVVDMQHYMVANMQARRENPEEDILSDLTSADYDDPVSGETRKLETPEVLSIVEQILVAGNETTTNGIGNGLHYLATHPDLQQSLRENPDRINDFVEEILRTESPVQGLFRQVLEDTELDGVALPKGSTVMIRYAAGNRDSDRFENAEEFNLERQNNGAHMAFGSGIHHCVGSQLARLEMHASFAAFLKRFKSFELAPDCDPTNYHLSFALRGPTALPIVFTPAG